jgi:branched-chain amino acid transport system ATP-binding protein
VSVLLEIRGLEVGYGAIPVLQGIDFDVEEGKTTVLLGLNGAGKTTTVGAISGLLKPWGGTISFEGERIDGLEPPALVDRGVTLVPEGRRVFPALSVAQNLRLGSWTKRKRGAELKDAEEKVYDYFPILLERRTQMAGTLSGGQQQMLAVGRGLMSLPKLILIDEASLGLSPALAKTVFNIVDRINADGTTVIIVEQNVGVLKHADNALVMEKGEIVYRGSGEELRSGDELRRTYLGGGDEEAAPAVARPTPAPAQAAAQASAPATSDDEPRSRRRSRARRAGKPGTG